MQQKKTILRLFFDTEFVCFDSYEPLSIGFHCPTHKNLDGYFQRTDIENALAHFKGNTQFLNKNVVSQLVDPNAMHYLTSKNFLTLAFTPLKTLDINLKFYFQSILRKYPHHIIELCADFDGDFLVLDKLFDFSVQQHLGLQYIHARQLVEQKKLSDTIDDLFEHHNGPLARHHAYLDAKMLATACLILQR